LHTLRQLLIAIVLVAVAYAGFRWGDVVFAPLERVLGVARGAESPAAPEQPSSELAERALDRFERFRGGEGGDRLALSGVELTSVLRFALPGVVPPGVVEPTVSLDDGDVRLSAKVAVVEFPGLPDLDEVVGMLPDTVSVDVRGGLVPLDQRHLSLIVDRLEVAGIPIPKRLIARVLDGLGRDDAGFRRDALTVPLPDGLERAYVRGDSLVLVARADGGEG
jgi:hypothetical protein